MDLSQYQPSPQVLEGVKQIDFVAIVGPTAVGKTTLIGRAAAANPGLHRFVATVSRAPRPEEQDGVDFHFVDRLTMEARASQGEYVTVIMGVSGDLYATAPEEYAAGKPVIMAVLADAMPMFRALPYRSFRTIFVLPPSWEAWQERLTKHSFTPDQRDKRLVEAKRSLEFALSDGQTQFVINEDLEAATKDVVALAAGQPLTPRLQAEQAQAHALVHILLKGLEAGKTGGTSV